MAMDGFAVNGTALVYVGTGSAGALELLGVTDQGVDVDVDELTEDVITDLLGPRVPQDVQSMAMTARIVAPLMSMDRTVLAKITGRGDRTTVGKINTPGLLLGTGGFTFAVGIASPFDAAWVFTCCIMRPGFGTRLATKANPFRCQFFGFPGAGYAVTAAKDTPLWTRTFS